MGLAMSGGAVLVAVRRSGAGHRGGTLVVRADKQATSTRSTSPFPGGVHRAIPAADGRRPGRARPGQRSGRSAARARPRDFAAGPDRRRQDVHLPAPARHPLFERQAGAGEGLRLHLRTRLRAWIALGLRERERLEHRRRCAMPDAPEAVRPLTRDRRQRRCRHCDLPSGPRRIQTFSTSSRSRPPMCFRPARRGGRPERTRCPRPAPT